MNAMLEQLMNRIIPELRQHIEENHLYWNQELRRIQTENKKVEEQSAKKRQANMTDDEQQLRCKNCDKFICMSSDIRRVQLSHHIAVDEDVPNRLIFIRGPSPKYVDEDLKHDGSIKCGDKTCQRKLGGVCEYEKTEFPMIAIEHFRVVNRYGQARTFKKWKFVNFKVTQFTMEDLNRIVVMRNNDY